MAGIAGDQGIEQEYRILQGGAGRFDRASRGRMRVEGADAASFLHALFTNDIAALARGAGAYAAYLTPQGRMIADMRVYHRGDSLLMDVPPGLAADLTTRLDAAIFSEDVRVDDVSVRLRADLVLGEGAAAAIAGAFDLDTQTVSALPLWAQATVTDGFVARTDDARVPSFELFLTSSAREAAIARLEGAGVRPMSAGLVDALRIDAGIPAFGLDMDTSTIPLEAGLLDRAISTTKGCYVGQEIIVRILHRGGGRVARTLVRVVLDESAALPAPGTEIRVDGQDIERVTSAAWSPIEHRVVVLGYVRRGRGTGTGTGSE